MEKFILFAVDMDMGIEKTGRGEGIKTRGLNPLHRPRSSKKRVDKQRDYDKIERNGKNPEQGRKSQERKNRGGVKTFNLRQENLALGSLTPSVFKKRIILETFKRRRDGTTEDV